MRVKDVMTRDVRTCGPLDTMNTAARIMWENDCGCVPIVDDAGKAIGMITDRDICMAAYTRGQLLAWMHAGSAASRGLVSVNENDKLATAETLMRQHQLRRLPVVDGEGRLVGILSINDIGRNAQPLQREGEGLAAGDVARTLAAISEHRIDETCAAE